MFTAYRSADETSPTQPWLGLYSGIMTIMLAFFLSLFCTGNARRDDKRFEAARQSLSSAAGMGLLRHQTKEEPVPPDRGASVPLSELERLVMGPGVTMYRIKHGMAVAVPASLLFMRDGITPGDASREILDKVVAYARCGSTRISVECCAMNANESGVAWDTSLRRAMAIGGYLTTHGVDASRICPVGMGRTPDSVEKDAGNNVIINFYYE